MLWPPHAKNRLLGKDPDALKVSRQEEKGPTEDEVVGWCHRLDGREFEKLMDKEAWYAAVHGAAKSQSLLSD